MKTIIATELISQLSEHPETIELIDVRSTNEYEESHLKEARNIPLHLLPLRLQEIDQNKSIIFLCRSGGRSSQAVLFATSFHIHASNLVGGMNTIEEHYPERVVRSDKKGFFHLF